MKRLQHSKTFLQHLQSFLRIPVGGRKRRRLPVPERQTQSRLRRVKSTRCIQRSTKHEETVDVGSLKKQKSSTACIASTINEVQLLVDEFNDNYLRSEGHRPIEDTNCDRTAMLPVSDAN
jgi:hypothetical protein